MGIITDYEYPRGLGAPYWMTLSRGSVILVGVQPLARHFMFPQAGAGGGKTAVWTMPASKPRTRPAPTSSKVTFEDVAGAEEEKAELQEIVDF